MVTCPSAPSRGKLFVVGACIVAMASIGCDRAPAPSTDTAAAPRPSGMPMGAASRVQVNTGPAGMLATVRWALSPDRDAVIVFEDPAGVEAEPVPGGFVMASESLRSLVQMDSVWDVAPSPDWRRAAAGRAHVLMGGRADTLPTATWDSIARLMQIPVADVRRLAFPASSMNIAFGVAQAVIVDLSPVRWHTFHAAVGWRVRWTEDGSVLLAGFAPAAVQNHAPATRWAALRPSSGQPMGEAPNEARHHDPGWVEGPLIDISVPPDTISAPPITVEGGLVESVDGDIRLGGRAIGRGVALAATRTGRYIVAIAPDWSRAEYEPKVRLVVYSVSP